MLPVVYVQPGTTYRLRIINAGQLVMQNVAIAHHELTVVAVESVVVDSPVTVSSLDVAPGQRYDVLFTTKTTKETTASSSRRFWMETTVRQSQVPDSLVGRAILQYTNKDEDASPCLLHHHPRIRHGMVQLTV